MEKKINNIILELVQGDITNLEVDAIVNAANTQLQLGLGVAGAIRKKGGPTIQKECDSLRKHHKLSVGEAIATNAGNLKANFVIHAVGPLGSDSNRKTLLRNAIFNSLILANTKNLSTIAFPAISTGIFGYPIQEAATVIIESCKEFSTEKSSLGKIIICLYDDTTYTIFASTIKNLE